jgi:hypothetical protein
VRPVFAGDRTSEHPLGATFEEYPAPVALPDGASDTHSLLAVQPDGKFIGRSTRTVTLRLRCGPSQTCNGRADLYLPPHHHAPRLAAGSGTFSIAPGHSRNVVVRLTHNGRVHLSGHTPTRVTLTLVLTDGPTHSTTIVVLARADTDRCNAAGQWTRSRGESRFSRAYAAVRRDQE